MGTQIVDDLETQLNPRAAVPDFQAYLDRAEARSRAVIQRLDARLDVRYGDGPLQSLDIYTTATGNAPVHVFIHGGYWRGLDKKIYAELAQPLVESGVLAILVNYDLCPTVTVDVVVEQVRAAIAWVFNNVQRFGGDAQRISVSGHSAGAHLAAMGLCHDWGRDGLPADVIKSSTLISGVYDLTSVPRLSVNQEIQLTPDAAERNSVMFLAPTTRGPALVAVGGEEPALWIQQSAEFSRRLSSTGLDTRYLEVGGEHHFSITDRLTDTDHALTRAWLDLAAGIGPRETSPDSSATPPTTAVV